MTQHIKQLAFAVALLASGTTCMAEDFTVDDIAYNITSEEEQTVAVAYNEGQYVGDVAIPARVDYEGTTYTVTALADQSFFKCADLYSVSIPATVSDLGRYTFSQCTSLQSVELPDSICEIPEGCFIYCTSLAEVSLPDAIEEIGSYGFGYCSSLRTINMPASLLTLGDMAFVGCAMTTFTLPQTIDEVPRYLLALNTALTQVTLHDKVSAIGECAFQGDPLLQTVELPESVRQIDASAFAQCTGLKTITIPDGVTAVPARCFYNDMALETVVLGKSVSSIGSEAFARYTASSAAPRLKDLTLKSEQLVGGGESFLDAACKQATLHVPASLVDAYKADASWSRFGSIVAIAEGGSDGIEAIASEGAGQSENSRCYNLAGQRVEPGQKGLTLQGGKKVLRK